MRAQAALQQALDAAQARVGQLEGDLDAGRMEAQELEARVRDMHTALQVCAGVLCCPYFCPSLL